MIKIIGSIKTRTRRVLWALEEMGLDYEHHPHPPRSSEVRRLNPSGKVPVMIEDDAAIADSTAILHYLADKHGKLTYPAGTLERARQDVMTFRLLDEVEGPLWLAARHTFILPEEMRVPAIKDSLKWEFGKAIARFGVALGEGPFLMGDRMTIPDIIAAHCGNWADVAKFPIEDPAFSAYLDRMRARPAAQKLYAE